MEILMYPSPFPPGYELLYNMLCAVHKDYLSVGKLASDFLSQDLKAKIRDVYSTLELQSTKERAKLSKRDEDPSWFEGNYKISNHCKYPCCSLTFISLNCYCSRVGDNCFNERRLYVPSKSGKNPWVPLQEPR